MSKIHFLIALHDHQPVGNFDSVFNQACDDAYFPFLEELSKHPQIRMTLHYSGSLLEWIEHNRPEFIASVKKLVQAGQVEIMGGGYYEPILTMLPERDRIGQICSYKQHLEEIFETRVRGVWLTERVWEQSLTRSLADAGVEYAILDDTHFKYAGLKEEDLNGYYVTEDEGRLLRLFAGNELLRYIIPFDDPWKTTKYLGEVNMRAPDSIMVYADDGEKFGVWPETHTHVYTNGWLERFFAEIERNIDWIEFNTFSEVIDRFPPKGKIYLPDASYREMTEWALPARVLAEYQDKVEELEKRGMYDKMKIHLRGGFWRNFKVKYPELNDMYSKSMRVSNKVESIRESHPKVYESARRELYRGQCNCAYWHGVFGGLYLPHLRHAIYEHLIEAEDIVDEALGVKGVQVEEGDYDMNGRPETIITNSKIRLVVNPGRGGHVTALDVRNKNTNLLAGLSRRAEAYHRDIINPKVTESDNREVKSIHHIVVSKEAGLDKLLHYDWYQHEGFVDHFLLPDVTLEQMMQCKFIERGNFVVDEFGVKSKTTKDGVQVELNRDGTVWIDSKATPVSMQKTYVVRPDSGDVECLMKITATQPLEIIFAQEYMFAFPGKEHDLWNYRFKDGSDAGEVAKWYDYAQQDEIGMVDRLKKLDISLRYSRPADIWLFPIRTVSQSESGFEHTFQSSIVVARWAVRLQPGEPWTLSATQGIRDIK